MVVLSGDALAKGDVLEEEDVSVENVSLGDFIETYGKALGEKIDRELTPIYNPMKADESVKGFENLITTLIRKPFPVQEEVIKGLAKALYIENRRKLFVQGEMGIGKTFISLSVAAMSSKPFRTLVVCPGHLVEKWIRETKDVIPDVKCYDLAVKDVISVLDALRYEKMPLQNHEVWVISKERAKLSHGWRPAFITTKRSGYLLCPDCGEKITGKDDEIITKTTLKKKRHICASCKNPLWQAVKPRRYSPAEYIKKYLKYVFDMVILDEIHDYKAGDSLQGHAMGQLLSSSRYFLGLTGAINGGYADNLFFLLYRLEPGNLKDFGYEGVQKWQKTYGVIEEIRKIEERGHAYSRIKRSNVVIKRKPGILLDIWQKL